MKNTTIQWYANEVNFSLYRLKENQITLEEFEKHIDELMHWALKFERDQIEEAYNEGVAQFTFPAEAYYTETYQRNEK